MNARTLLAVAVAASVLLAGAVAAGAATPAEPANDNAPDEADRGGDDRADGDETDSDAADADENATDGDETAAHAGPPSDVPAAAGGNDTEATQGPPSDLPEQVPDRVGEIHATIDAFLNDDVGSLGDALAGMLGGDEQAAENATA